MNSAAAETASHAAMETSRAAVEPASHMSVAPAEACHRMIMKSTSDGDRTIPIKVTISSSDHNRRSPHH